MTFALSVAAAEELGAYLDRIVADDPVAAIGVEQRVLSLLDRLAERPGLGRRTRIRGWPRSVRSFVATPLPLRIFYQETLDGIFVVRVFHAARSGIER